MSTLIIELYLRLW